MLMLFLLLFLLNSQPNQLYKLFELLSASALAILVDNLQKDFLSLLDVMVSTNG